MLKIATRPSGRSVIFRVVIAIAITYLAVIQLRVTFSESSIQQWENVTDSLPAGSNHGAVDDDGCGGLMDFGHRLVVTVKTGATEAADGHHICCHLQLGYPYPANWSVCCNSTQTPTNMATSRL